jgi:UDP-N-acetylglucosamine--N-acetylmuramyl-(pentapeptide) pyrophosphoryl-undecaprenol N-acetylglucosamine transferase
MAVLLFGGFSSFALGTWAIRKRVPIHLFEQNTVPGRVNRLLSYFAESAYLTFPLKKYSLGRKKQSLTGNPVRPPMASISDPKYDILILGGSQGAASLNQRLPVLLDPKFKICHVCGPGREGEVNKSYPNLENVTVVESHPNIPELLSQSRWVVSRAGATSLSEMAAAGTATLTVPLPTAKDDHQRYNAEVLRDQDAVEMLLEHEFEVKKDWLNELLKDSRRAKELKKNILASGLADVKGVRALSSLNL